MSSRHKVLFLSHWFPFPADNGSKLRIGNLLQGLSKEHDVVLVSFDDEPSRRKDITEARSVCCDLHLVPYTPYDPRSLRACLGLIGPAPRSIMATFSTAMVQRISQVLATHQPEAVIASQLGTAVYHRSFRHVPALFEEVEVGLVHQLALGDGRWLRRLRHWPAWWKHRRFLQNLLREFETCTVVSDTEKALLMKLFPSGPGIETIPNCIDLGDYQGFRGHPKANTIVFTGSFRYGPNYEAMAWFTDSIYPRIKAQIPEATLTITGDPASQRLPRAEGVVQTGHIGVEDLRHLIASAWVSVAPIVSGGGTRLKILEAMALRTPVVTTRKGAEGLELEHDNTALMADTPEEFARQVVRILREPATRQRLVTNAYALVQRKYDWSIVTPRFTEAVDSLMDKGASSRRRRRAA